MPQRRKWALAGRASDEAATVLVVDDEPDLRFLIARALDADPGFTVVAEAEDGQGAIDQAREHQPDIVVLDLRMPGVSGREALPRILVESPRSMVVVLSALQARIEAGPVLSEGAFAYVEKGALGDHLAQDLAALLSEFRRALRGETVLAGRPAVSLAEEARDLNR